MIGINTSTATQNKPFKQEYYRKTSPEALVAGLKQRHVAYETENNNPYAYTAKQKRLFHRTYSGLQRGYYEKQMLIFLTLTTEYQKTDKFKAKLRKSRRAKTGYKLETYGGKTGADITMNDHWQNLKKNIDYAVQLWRFETWLYRTHPEIDVSTKQGRKEYRRQKQYNWDQFKFRLCYLKVRTTEGGGVLHVLIRKNRNIPIIQQKFIKQQWDRIHGGEQVDIQEIPYNPDGDLKSAMNCSFYFCGNYFNQQPVVRQSSSYNWIFQGAAATWVRGKTILKPKRILKERIHNQTYEDEEENTYTYSRFVEKPNVLLKRQSLIQAMMNSRRADKSNGYINALTEWLRLLKYPPPQTRQKRFATVRQGETHYKFRDIQFEYGKENYINQFTF